MPVKSSTTKRSPSTSKAKKKPVKAKTKKVIIQPKQWDIYWLRTMNGEEYVAEGVILDDGFMMVDPTMLTYLSGNLVLAPYGLMASKSEDGVRPFFIPLHAVLHLNEASDEIRDLYRVSLETSTGYCEKHFTGLIERSLRTLQGAISEGMREPTPEEIEALEQIFSGEAPDIDVEQPTRSKSQTIDDLVKLAESKGKGKKIA